MNSLTYLSLLAGPVSYGDGASYEAFELTVPLVGPTCCRRASRVESYVPQPGDLVLFSHPNPLVHGLYALSRVGSSVTHAGMIVTLPDGKPGLLEAPLCQRVTIRDPAERIREYHGATYVRRRIKPLSPEENAKLTAFACEQVTKRFHLLGMVKPIVLRPVHSSLARYPTPENLNRSKWMCSSLVVAACVSAGLMDPYVVRPSYASASDLFTDTSLDLSCGWERPAQLRLTCSQRLGVTGIPVVSPGLPQP